MTAVLWALAIGVLLVATVWLLVAAAVRFLVWLVGIE